MYHVPSANAILNDSLFVGTWYLSQHAFAYRW